MCQCLCVLQFHFLYFLAFGVIIIGIVIYTVHLPKTAAESDLPDSKQSSSACVPVNFTSLSYQNGSSINDSAAVEVQVASHNSDDMCTDQLMCGHDVTTSPPTDDNTKSPPTDDNTTNQQLHNSPLITSF